MLRKIGNIITMCLLLVSTTGFTVSEHFCGTQLISVEINREAEPCCDNGMCCHTDTQFFQMDEDFNYTASIFDFQTFVLAELPQPMTFLSALALSTDREKELYADFESPPPQERKAFLSSVQTYLL